MNRNIIIGWFARGVVLCLSFLNSGLLLSCLGAEGYALYTIIISLTPWIALLNFSIPITIQNLISTQRNDIEEQKKIKKNAFGAMILLIVVFLPLIVITSILTKKYILHDYEFLKYSTMIVIITLIFISSLCQVMTQIMYAEYDSFWPNIYPIFVPVWTTMVLALSKMFDLNNINLVILLISFSFIFSSVHSFIKLDVFKEVKIDIKEIFKFIKNSKSQLIFSFFAASTLAVDYVIMSKILKPEDIVQYNLTSRLFLAIQVFTSVIIISNWTKISDLMHNGNKQAARIELKKIVNISILIGSICGLILIITADEIIDLLTSGAVSKIPLLLKILFFSYLIIRIWTDAFAMALQSYNKIDEINIFLPLQALISISLQVYLGMKYGSIGIIAGLLASFILTVSWLIPAKFHIYTK